MANRVRELRKERSLTLDDLADRTGISNSYLSRIEGGSRGLSIGNVIKIASALGVEPMDVTSEFDQSDLEAASTLPLQMTKPVNGVANIDIKAGMGGGGYLTARVDSNGSIAPEHINGHWTFPPEVVSQWAVKNKTYAFRVDGDSMEPTLVGGSYVFVDTTVTYPSPPDIYVIDYGDGLMVKRVELVPKSDKILIISDNDKYTDRELLRDDVNVWGRVVAWFQWRG